MDVKKRHVYQIGEGICLFSETMPRRLSPSEGERVLRHAMFARELGKKGSVNLTPAERKQLAMNAARARWGKKP